MRKTFSNIIDMSDRKRTAALVALSAASILLATEIDKYENAKRKKRKFEYLSKELSAHSGHKILDQSYFDLDYIKENLRCSDDTFDLLLKFLHIDLQQNATAMNFSPRKQLISTLRFLISDGALKPNGLDEHCALEYFNESVPKICEVIYKNLKDTYLMFPDTERDWRNIAKEFGAQWLFPQCVGALGAKHIEFECDEASDLFLNHKGSHSIIMLALTDAKSKFTCIEVGCNGASDFDEALEGSQLWEVIQDGHLYFPKPHVINESKVLPYVVVADNTFPLHKNIMTPYADTNELPKKIYNQRLSVAKQTVDHSFRILKSRFKLLVTKITAQPEKVQTIAVACCVLHNFFMTHSEGYSTIQARSTEEIGSPISIKEPSEKAPKIRSLFVDYFLNEGKI